MGAPFLETISKNIGVTCKCALLCPARNQSSTRCRHVVHENRTFPLPSFSSCQNHTYVRAGHPSESPAQWRLSKTNLKRRSPKTQYPKAIFESYVPGSLSQGHYPRAMIAKLASESQICSSDCSPSRVKEHLITISLIDN